MVRRRRLLGLFVAVGAALIVAGVAYCTRHTIAPDTLAHVSIGTSSDEVIRVLGKPRFTRRDTDGGLVLAYRMLDRWCTIDVSFDPAQRVRSVFHDH